MYVEYYGFKLGIENDIKVYKDAYFIPSLDNYILSRNFFYNTILILHFCYF